MSARLAVVPDNADASAWEATAAAWRRTLRSANKAPRTIGSYIDSVGVFAAWATDPDRDRSDDPTPVPILDPEDVTKEDVEAWQAWALSRITRFGRQASPGAVAKDYRHLRVFFRWLADRDGLTSVMAGTSAPVVPEQPVDVFTDDELAALQGACKGRAFVDVRDHLIIRMLFDTGIRRAELVGLTLDDLDLDSQLIRVMGKGRRGRTVPYGAKTAEVLDRYLRARGKHADKRLPNLFLADPQRRGALGIDGVGQMLNRRAAIAGVKDVHPHRFRHTAADAWFRAEGREGDAMRLFGWKTRVMVDRYAASAAHDRAIEASRKMSPGDRV